MKKFLTLVLAICLVIPCAFMISGCKDKKTKTPIETWDGTRIEVSSPDENGVIIIETAEELAGLAEEVNDGNTFEGITIKLGCDIDLLEKEWTPIGYGSANGLGTIDSTSGAYFKGIFDGQNKTIHNLKITTFDIGGYGSSNASCGVALFGNIYEAEIKNLKIDDAEVVGNHFVGALVGFSIGSNITNCHVDDVEVDCVYDNSDDSGDKAGAIVGYMAIGNGSTISNCSAKDSTVKADRDAGQVIGCLAGGATQTNNTAEDVEVLCNESGVGSTTNSGKNIREEIVGRIA